MQRRLPFTKPSADLCQVGKPWKLLEEYQTLSCMGRQALKIARRVPDPFLHESVGSGIDTKATYTLHDDQILSQLLWTRPMKFLYTPQQVVSVNFVAAETLPIGSFCIRWKVGADGEGGQAVICKLPRVSGWNPPPINFRCPHPPTFKSSPKTDQVTAKTLASSSKLNWVQL